MQTVLDMLRVAFAAPALPGEACLAMNADKPTASVIFRLKDH